MFRLAVVASHPVQYYAPLFSELAQRSHLHVFYTQAGTPEQQSRAGFGTGFSWDLDLLNGYDCSFLDNISLKPDPSRFSGANTPGVFRSLRDGSFDAVLIMGWYLKAHLQALVAAKLVGLPVLVRGDSHLGTERGWPKRLLKAALWPSFLRQFDVALYVGSRNMDYYMRYGYPRSRLFHSPHAVDNDRFSRSANAEVRFRKRSALSIEPDERVALFAGKLVEFKRPMDVVEIVAGLRGIGKKVSVLVAGSGPLQEAISDRARELAVPIRLVGFQNQTQLPAIYAAADALVLPSASQETWGLVCNEAIACGTPIVVSDQVGCAPDLAGTGAAGECFPVGDLRAGAKALLSVLESPPSAAALERIAETHSLQSAARGIEVALEWLLRNAAQNRSLQREP